MGGGQRNVGDQEQEGWMAQKKIPVYPYKSRWMKKPNRMKRGGVGSPEVTWGPDGTR